MMLCGGRRYCGGEADGDMQTDDAGSVSGTENVEVLLEGHLYSNDIYPGSIK